MAWCLETGPSTAFTEISLHGMESIGIPTEAYLLDSADMRRN